MRQVAIAALLAIGVALAGMEYASAQDDPAVLLKLVRHTQNQIAGQISDDSPAQAREMFERGAGHVDSMQDALDSGNAESARSHFASAMDIFKEVSRHLSEGDRSHDTSAGDPTSDLKRLSTYVSSLKSIAKGHGAQIDFAEIDALLGDALEQIHEGRYQDASATLQQVKEGAVEASRQLYDEASEQESERAQRYAQKYLERLDEFVADAQRRGVPEDVLERLEVARAALLSAESPQEIANHVRSIILIKDEIALGGHDAEYAVLRAEQEIYALSQTADAETLQDAIIMLEEIRRYIADGDPETAQVHLEDLQVQLDRIKNATRS